MQLTRRTFLAGLAGGAAIGPAATVRAGGYSLRLAHNYPVDWPIHESLVAGAERVRDETDWLVSLEIFSDGQLGRSEELIKLLYDYVDLALLPAWLFAGMSAGLAALAQSGLFASFDHWSRFADSKAEQVVAERLWDLDLELIGSTWLGPDHLFAQRPVARLSDLNGLKLRIPGGSFGAPGIYESLGATPVRLPYAETYMALQGGYVDGTVVTLPYAQDAGFYEVSKSVNRVPLGGLTGWLVASRRLGHELGDYEHEVLRRVLREALSEAGQVSQARADEALDRIATSGVVVTALDDTERAELRARLIDRMLKELPNSGEIVRLVHDLE